MSSIVIKLGSLVVKTLSKPIANRIKAQAREHEKFRRICVNFAQGIHRWDMRFRLGLLQDSAALEKQAAREAAEAQAKKHKSEAPTVKTEAQSKADEAAEARSKEGLEKSKEQRKKPKIRPLSEAKAIDLGSNFVSESFLFLVGVSLVFFETYRRSKQETSKREDVADQIEKLEKQAKLFRKAFLDLEKETMKNNSAGITGTRRILPKEVYELEGEEEKEDKPRGWLSWFQGIYRRDVQEDDMTPEPSVVAREVNPQSASSGQDVHTLNEPKPTSILSRILPTALKKDSMRENPKNLTTENNSSGD
ncbi:optic atrophy 3 protein-domain-containing protein [Usnea florida]